MQYTEEDAISALEALKSRLISAPVLALPQRDRPYKIDTDASAYQLGAALQQQQDLEDESAWSSIGYWSKTSNSAEQNYSATERECFSVVWDITTLRPYLEGTKFTVRTDDDALRWMLTLTEPSGILMRWRLRLSEFDFKIVYRPGRVHQVPDALSRLVRPTRDTKPVEDEIPTFGDHLDPGLVATCGRSWIIRATANHGDVASANPSHAHDEILDDTFDETIDFFDPIIADEEIEPAIVVADVPMPITIPELLESQRADELCQTVLSRQSRKPDSLFRVGDDGVLRRAHPRLSDVEQIVLPANLRPRVFKLAHYSKLARHPRSG